MNQQLEQIKTIENLIAQTKQALKAWANQISQYHKTLKALSQQLTALKGEIMNKNNNSKLNNSQNNQGGTN